MAKRVNLYKEKIWQIVDKYQNVLEWDDGQTLFTKDEADDILLDMEFQARKLGCEECDPNGYFKQWQKAGYRKQKLNNKKK